MHDLISIWWKKFYPKNSIFKTSRKTQGILKLLKSLLENFCGKLFPNIFHHWGKPRKIWNNKSNWYYLIFLERSNFSFQNSSLFPKNMGLCIDDVTERGCGCHSFMTKNFQRSLTKTLQNWLYSFWKPEFHEYQIFPHLPTNQKKGKHFSV